MTVLYILQHNVTGKKYFGKTIHPEKLGVSYFGSGVDWTKHRKKYGSRDVSVVSVSEVFTDTEELEEFALFLSRELNIVESEDYLNLKEETGTDGGTTGHTLETRKRIGESVDYEKQGASLSATMNDPEWRKAVGEQAVKKRLAKQDFAATGRAISRAMNDPEWKRTVGVSSRKKQVENTDYSKVARRSADTRLTEEWKSKNSYDCEDCGAVILGAGNYKQHKGSIKCLQKQEKEFTPS